MNETIEIAIAGQMVFAPMGASISLPYLPWTPTEIQNLTEDDREYALKVIRDVRERTIQGMSK